MQEDRRAMTFLVRKWNCFTFLVSLAKDSPNKKWPQGKHWIQNVAIQSLLRLWKNLTRYLSNPLSQTKWFLRSLRLLSHSNLTHTKRYVSKGITHVPFGHEEKHYSWETHKLFWEYCTSESTVSLDWKGEREHKLRERTLGSQLSMDVKKTKKTSELQRWGISFDKGKVFQKVKPSAWGRAKRWGNHS